MVISKKLQELIQDIIATEEFWKINYYMRSMKKAPHGGVFYNWQPNNFLKNNQISTFIFFSPNVDIPTIVLESMNFFVQIISNTQIDTEDILKYCLGINPNDKNNIHNGNRLYVACCGKVITSSKCSEIEHINKVYNATEGKINFSENFEVDYNRLLILFLFTLMEEYFCKIQDINEIELHEKLSLQPDKYGLSDVTRADFRRQGFVLNDMYYLYNIFIDTSIGGQIVTQPKIIEIINSVIPQLKISMRCDENLSASYANMVETASVDFQKWRGITLSFNDIDTQIRNGKETIVHFDPETLHKILVYIKRGTDESGVEFYHMNVEQLWNPEKITASENVIITNYVHGTYYPVNKTFEHIDFSVNQYNRDVYEKKYCDAESLTGVSIGAYSDLHYKIWCIRGDNITTEIWVNLVCASLDEPFRSIFMETIDGKYLKS